MHKPWFWLFVFFSALVAMYAYGDALLQTKKNSIEANAKQEQHRRDSIKVFKEHLKRQVYP
jgi:hypothetical protein